LKVMAWTKMKTTAAVAVVVLLTAGTATLAVKTIQANRPQPNIQGAWEGMLEIQGSVQRMVLNVSKENGSFRASGGSVDQRQIDLPASEFIYNRSAISLKLPLLPEMDTKGGVYEAVVNSSGTKMSGEWRQAGLSVPLVLKRTSTHPTVPALLTARDYAPRAGSDLQGYWKGTLMASDPPLRLAFKISELSSETFQAELDSIDQNAMNRVVSSVGYDKPTVRLEIAGNGSVYEGEVNGAEIVGVWMQAGMTAPVTFRRGEPWRK
jgi:hypothetical protein